VTGEQRKKWAAALLRGHDFPGQDVGAIETVLERCERRIYKQDALICTEGEPGEALFFLVDGGIEVRKSFPGKTPRELARLKAPAMLGHMSLVDGSKRSATCIARSTTTLLVMDKGVYESLMDEVGPVGTNFRRLMLTSLTRQLLSGNLRLRDALGGFDLNVKGEVVAAVEPVTEDLLNDELLEMAGILEGWTVDTSGFSQITLVEDEDMKRMRESKENTP
jgi:CRP/FNR family cyclic AMP-dependent transcriptional regulator